MQVVEGDLIRVEGGDGLWRVQEVGKTFINVCNDEFEWIEIAIMADEIIEVVE